MDRPDPFYQAAAVHFDYIFRRFGHPCIVLNLVKVCAVAHIPHSSIQLVGSYAHWTCEACPGEHVASLGA